MMGNQEKNCSEARRTECEKMDLRQEQKKKLEKKEKSSNQCTHENLETETIHEYQDDWV